MWKSLIFIPIFMSMYAYPELKGQSSFKYQQPHQDIAVLADAPPAPAIRLDKKAAKGVLMYRHAYRSIEELSEPELKLAGMRINPVQTITSRMTYYYNLKVLDVASGTEYQVKGLPSPARLSNFAWSPNQQWMAFTHTTDKGVELWLLDMSGSTARRLTDDNLNAAMGNPFVWNRDSKSLIVKKIPSGRLPLRESHSVVPEGPVIAENDGQKAQNRTYQDLLQNPQDAFNLEQLIISRLETTDLEGNSKTYMPEDMYGGISPSPDGRYLLISVIKKPFSYAVPLSRFPMDYIVADQKGRKIQTIASIPLQEELPKGFMAVRQGRRNIGWRSDKEASIYWAEALDKGDPAVQTTERDEIFEWAAPFTDTPVSLAKTRDRFQGVIWGSADIAILTENWWDTRTGRTLIFNPSDPGKSPVLFNERNTQDKYNDPGTFVTEESSFGTNILSVKDGSIFMMGEGYQKNGKFPFIDKYDLKTLSKERLYQSSDSEKLEELMSAIDLGNGTFLTRLESKNEFPNYYIRNIRLNTLNKITKFENPYKLLDKVHKEVITYKREDGLELSGTLYLPSDYHPDKKGTYPMIMWAYPTEFKDKSSAGQVTANSNEFTAPYYGSPLYWVNRGYVVLDDAAFPIVGEGNEEPNDTFIPQLVSNARAAIDAVDSLGYIDRRKVAVGGHSYGAFMTANLLTHSDLFAAGIARSGAYNRSLTPFGFQSEQRNFWEAQEVYQTMSPFNYADKMKTPMLLIHGEADNNAGTHTLQSERYFHALKGLGATARLVLLPRESHGYAARESIMHMLWEQDQWLDKYVKNRQFDEKP